MVLVLAWKRGGWVLAPFAGAEGVLDAGLVGLRGVFGSLHTTYIE